jgi:hypothetical protein
MERLIPDFTSAFRTNLQIPPKLSVAKLGNIDVKQGKLSGTTKDVIKFAKALINRISDPEKTLDTVFNELDSDVFKMLTTHNYLVEAAKPFASDIFDANKITVGVATQEPKPTKPIYYTKDGKTYIVKEEFLKLITVLSKVETKGFMASLFKTIGKLLPFKSSGDDEYKMIYDKLPEPAKEHLKKLGYTASSEAFRSLVDYIKNSTAFKIRCDENQFIDSLVSGNDRIRLKQKLEGLLKKLDLNSEDEFIKFQKMVVETLTDQFSLFSRFKQKVIDELYKVGIPQIPLIEADFFEILNDKQHILDIKDMKNAYADFDYDNI